MLDSWLEIMWMATDVVLDGQFLEDDLDVDFAYTLCLEVAISPTAKQLPPQRRQPIVLMPDVLNQILILWSMIISRKVILPMMSKEVCG